MAIPESQLETWSHPGSITQSCTTYNTIKNVLEDADSPYALKDYEVFLQGSYGNDTNIYAESDVDIVIRLNDCWLSDLKNLSEEEKKAYKSTVVDAKYTHVDFKRDVVKVLTDEYGSDVSAGDKAIAIEAGGNRRKADVIAAIQFRRYYKFKSASDQSHVKGICFYNSSGEQIVNYPKQHSDNCTKKHQNTNEWFKPLVRISKNLRNRLIEEKMLAEGTAPSYFLEGLLYNVPSNLFETSYEDCLCNAINWIDKADKATKDKFVCANEQYYLLRDGSRVTWREADCEAFLRAAIKLWNEW